MQACDVEFKAFNSSRGTPNVDSLLTSRESCKSAEYKSAATHMQHDSGQAGGQANSKSGWSISK